MGVPAVLQIEVLDQLKTMGLFWFILGSLLWHLPVVVDDICVVGLLFELEHNAHFFWFCFFISKGSGVSRGSLW